ncbi:MAG: hypothetical protein K0Q72_4563, partial [Armatimonadetes bacterium]|nr:hypothetical protein [Armatimonadota bacterium]
GELTEAEIEAVAEEDPAPALYLSSRTPGERAAARFLGSLPDEAHAQLGTDGYLKWRVDRLPPTQRAWVKEAARVLEARGEGPFPLSGKTPSYTGFARVDVIGLEQPQYCWWIASDLAPRPAWITLVRSIGLLTEAYGKSYGERMPAVVKLADSELPELRWVRIREMPAKAAPAPPVAPAMPLTGEKEYWEVVRACRGDLKKESLRALVERDTLLDRRLKSTDPAIKAMLELFAKLPEEQHRALLTTGRLVWSADDLTKQQRKLVDTLLRDVNARGDGSEPFLLSPALATRTGFALVTVPGVETAVISWWVSSPTGTHPTWIPLMNAAAVAAPGYFRAHLEQLPRG